MGMQHRRWSGTQTAALEKNNNKKTHDQSRPIGKQHRRWPGRTEKNHTHTHTHKYWPIRRQQWNWLGPKQKHTLLKPQTARRYFVQANVCIVPLTTVYSADSICTTENLPAVRNTHKAPPPPHPCPIQPSPYCYQVICGVDAATAVGGFLFFGERDRNFTDENYIMEHNAYLL